MSNIYTAKILDLTFKTTFWKKDKPFIINYLHFLVNYILEIFKELLDEYDKKHTRKVDKQPIPSASSASTLKKAKQPSSFFSSELYNTTNETNKEESVHTELALYLKEDLEPEGTDVLSYWS